MRQGSREMKSLDMLHEQIDGQLRLAQLDPLQGSSAIRWTHFMLHFQHCRAVRVSRFCESCLSRLATT